MNFDDIMFEKGYELFASYSQSKLANILFTKGLQRRLSAKGSSVVCHSVHPGCVRTEVTRHMHPLMQVRSIGAIDLYRRGYRGVCCLFLSENIHILTLYNTIQYCCTIQYNTILLFYTIQYNTVLHCTQFFLLFFLCHITNHFSSNQSIYLSQIINPLPYMPTTSRMCLSSWTPWFRRSWWPCRSPRRKGTYTVCIQCVYSVYIVCI